MDALILLTDLPDPIIDKIRGMTAPNGYRVEVARNRDECQASLLNDEVMALVINQRLVNEDHRLLEVLKFYSNKVQLILFLENEEFDPKRHLTQGVVGVLAGDAFDEKILLTFLNNAERLHTLDEKMETQNALIQDNQSIAMELNLKNKVLERERNFNDSIISSIAYGLMIVDTEGAIMLLNDVGKKIFGISSTDYYGRDYREVVFDSFKQNTEIGAREALEKGEPQEIDSFLVDGDKLISCTISNIRDNFENSIGIMFLGRDITEGEQIKNQLFQAEKLATMGTMLSGIAHELRNPLTIINARAQRLRTNSGVAENEKIRQGIESIEAQSRRCGEIVTNLLDFSRKRAVGFELANISEIIEAALKFLQYEGRAENIKIVRHLHSPGMVRADRVQMEQVALNLLTNAVDAMEEKGTLTLETGNFEGFVRFSVSDTGQGIREELLKKIFDPFYTTKEAGKGTGLGLAIVFKIVQRHKGRIFAKSEVGRGTTFTVLLPKE